MNKTVQRIVTLLLALVMVCGMIPAVFATDTGLEDTATDTTLPTEETLQEVPAEETTPLEESATMVTDPVNATEPTMESEPVELPESTDASTPTEETVPTATVPSEPITAETDPSVTEPTESSEKGTTQTADMKEEVSASRIGIGSENVPMVMSTRAAIMGTHYQRAIIWLSSDDSELKFTHNNIDYSVNRLYVHGVSVDGTKSVAYCIDPGVATTEESGSYTGSDTAWDALDIDTQTAVGLAVLYGAPNAMASTDKKTMLTYEFATQIIIHEILLGYRSNLPPFECVDDKIITKFGTNADGSTNGLSREIISASSDYSSLNGKYIDRATLRSAYDTITANMAYHYILPSFASRYDAAAKTYEMTQQSNGTYAVTITDTNNILSNCNIQNGNGLTYTVSGNKLTITADTPFDGVKSCAMSDTGGVAKNVPNLEHETFLLWEANTYQRLITLMEPQNDPVPIYFNVRISSGDISVQKDTEDGLNKKGWLFGAYDNASCTSLIAGPAATDSNGVLKFEGLSAGTIWIKELGHENDTINAIYECASTNPQKVTVVGGETTTVTFKNNLRYGSITFRKATTSGIGVELGWTAKLWRIESSGSKTYIGSGTTKKDKKDPSYTFEDLLPGKYLLQEDPDSAKKGYALDTTAYNVTVTAGKNTSVTITNVSLGNIQIVKDTNTGKDIAGRKFNVFTDKALTKHFPGSPFTTDKNGKILAEAPPGTYYIQEVDESASNPGWIFDTSVKKVTVKAHETASVTFTNIQQGYGQIIKDMPDGGSVKGWSFDLHRASDNQYIATYTTGSKGSVNTDWFLPGEYLVYEKIPEDSLYYCETENPQKVTIKAGEVTKVTFVNRLKPAQLGVQKSDVQGSPLQGVQLLLEWSEDGRTWKAVTHTTSKYVTKGTCSTEGLRNGILTTPKNGKVTFTGLHPEMYYRITEVSTTDGKQLMAAPLFEGKIPQDDLAETVSAVNSSTFVLPFTGAYDMVILPGLFCLCLLMGSTALLTLCKKKHS